MGRVVRERSGIAPTTDAALTIGELAAQAGITTEAIRYYEREGVIPRAARVGAGKYRRYGAADIQRLHFIRRAREFGFSLDEVRELLELAGDSPSEPCADVNRLARAHLAAIDEKLAQLTGLREELAQVIGDCDGTAPTGQCRILAALNARAG